MRALKERQMLTTGIVDGNRNQISPDVIDWSEFDKNPVLLYNPETEGHYGVVVGQVVDRERTGDGFSARLEFGEGFEAADVAWTKYKQGLLPYVSVGGWASGSWDEEREAFVADQYLIKEVSLVKIPANLEARKIETKEVAAADQWFFEGREESGQEVRFVTMSAELAKPDTEGAPETQTEEVNASQTETQTEEVNASQTEPKTEEVNASQTEPKTEEVNASQDEPEPQPEPQTEPQTEPKTEPKTEEVNASQTEPQIEEVNASADNQNGERRVMPDGMTWHEHSQINKPNKNFMDKTFKQLNCDADFQKRMMALNSAFRTNAPSADNTPENVETVKMLASAMLMDEKMVIIASATNFTNGVTKERTNGLKFLVECAAGNAAAATLAAADLGMIKWLSLFYDKLLPNNTFMRSCRFVPMSDREGAIYVESGINAETYIGACTPVNAPNYIYDDIKRTIARHVFSIQPITFRNAEMAILAYDKQSWGWQIAMDSLMSDVSTFILQVAANTPNIAKIGTSGKAFSSQGAFPVDAPNSNVSIKSVSAADLLNVEGEFLKQNYRLNDRMVETVLPSQLFSKLAGTPEFITNLTRDLEGTIRNELRFMGNRVTPRNPVATVDTADQSVSLNEKAYADKRVEDNGTLTAIDDLVTGATHVGAGLAFVEGEIIAGVGTIDVIVMPDPANYGVTMSGWMSAGATVARENGKGVALVIPTVE